MIKIPIEVSARHIHLCKKDLEKLFGKNYDLTPQRWLSQKGQFAARETVTIKTKKGKIENIRLVGPLRSKTQVEISRTDAYSLKINPPIRRSGDTGDSPGLEIISSYSRLRIKKGVIIAQRHLHTGLKEAKRLDIKDGQLVSIKVQGKRALVFNKVVVRVDSSFKPAIHIDTDEANAADISNKTYGELIR
jgi:putative phosphotransacetylase